MEKRTVLVFSLFAFLMGLLCIHLISINSNPEIARAAVSQTTKSRKLGETRGYIYDYQGKPLVNESSTWTVCMKPDSATLEAAQPILKTDNKESLYNDLAKGNLLACAATAPMEGENIKSVRCVERYLDTGTAVHLIGYVNRDGDGVCGLEKAYDSLLKRASGTLWARCYRDAKGHLLDGTELFVDSRHYNAKSGIKLTLDKDVQAIAEAALENFQVQKGAVVVLDAETAEIRAMASVPVFNQNAPEESLQNDDGAFLNRAVTPYAVGSVFKPVVAAAALEAGITPSFSVFCTGQCSIGGTVFHCHKKGGHGEQTMPDAMANSCNPYFIKLFDAVGKDAVCGMGENLGLGTRIELSDNYYTKAGIMPTTDTLHSPQDEANLSFGQGKLLASPLQMAAMYAAIANGGVYRAPSLMRAIVDDNGEDVKRAFLPVPRRAMSKETAQELSHLLTYTVDNGSCNRAKPENGTAAGKSGTAQSGWKNDDGVEIDHAWFCGWFPSDQPRYVISVLKEDGKSGSLDCAPIFKAIAEGISEKELAEKGK